jgi:hypothetical protein
MDTVYNRLPRGKSGHFLKSRTAEIWLGIILFLAGALLLYDAFDARGKKIPWPGGAIAPW